ncbi:MAG: PQQ-binding-like beta-propeller repeat protein [bacterium]
MQIYSRPIMCNCPRLSVVVLALASAACALADTLPAPLPDDNIPTSWTAKDISWKDTWDATLAANLDGDALDRTSPANRATSEVGNIERTLRMRRIHLLKAMITRFPAERNRHAQAYQDIALQYSLMDDRGRAIQWYWKLAGEFPDRTNLVASACGAILRCSQPFSSLPDSRAWVAPAARKLLAIELANPTLPDPGDIDLARRLPVAALISKQKYIDARRHLDSMRERSGHSAWWLSEMAALMKMAGSLVTAASLYTEAGDHTVATNILARVEAGISDDVAFRLPQELAIRWKTLQDRLTTPDANALMESGDLQELLRLSADSWAMISGAQGGRIQLWTGIDQRLRSASPDALLSLRSLQEKTARSSALELRRTYDADAATRLFRRYPWAQSVHETLLEAGEMELLNGHNNTAQRCFEDVISHATSPSLIAQAHAGLWLTMVQAHVDRQDLNAAMAQVPDSTSMVWQGTNLFARDLKAMFTQMAPPPTKAPADLSAVRRIELVLPSQVAEAAPLIPNRMLAPWSLGPWAINRVEVSGNFVALAGPGTITGYDGRSRSALWSHATAGNRETGRLPLSPAPRRGVGNEQASRPVSPGSARSPAIAPSISTLPSGLATRRAVYALTLSQGPAGGPANYQVAAFEADGGRILWTTGDIPELQDTSPMNSPAVSDGRVYFVAAGTGTRAQRPLFLVCLNACTGAVVWQRRICAIPPPEQNDYDLAVSGSPVTIHQGAVYLSTDLGIIGKFDVRDGVADWIQSYSGALDGALINLRFSREGSSPLVSGNMVFFAPRDHTGAFACDRSTGRLIWDAPLVTSDQIIGRSGNAIVLAAGPEIAALDVNTGEELWNRSQGKGAVLQALITGTEILALAGNRFMHLSAATGAELASTLIPRAPGSELVLMQDGAIAEIREELPAVAPEEPAAKAVTLRPPFRETWRLACDYPALAWQPPGAKYTGYLALMSGRSIICVKTSPKFEFAWQRRLRNRQDSLGIHGGLVIAAMGGELTAMDTNDGSTIWTACLPFRADLISADGEVVIAAQASPEGRIAALDARTGSILWSRWLGRDSILSGHTLNWVSLRSDPSGKSVAALYWQKIQASKQGSRLTEVLMDPATGVIRDCRPFLPTESAWPDTIAFGDDTRASRDMPGITPWPRLGPFPADAVAYIGTGTVAGILFRNAGEDRILSIPRPAAVTFDAGIRRPVSVHPTDYGTYIRSPSQLELVDARSSPPSSIVYALPPVSPPRTARDIMDFRTDKGTVTVVDGISGLPGNLESDQYAWNGLLDCNGRGSISLSCSTGRVLFSHMDRRLPEAGSNVVAALLSGVFRQSPEGSRIRVSGLNTLGWSRYDVYLYGFTGKASIAGFPDQQCGPANYGINAHRSTFISGTNYVKFTGVGGDGFQLNCPENHFAAIQIVGSSIASPAGRPEAIGINWTGGGPALQPYDVVGAEVPHGNWYNINEHNVLTGGPLKTADGLSDISLTVFDRSTGRALSSTRLPSTSASVPSAFYRNQAKLLNGAIVTADPKGIYVFRPSGN